MTTKKKRGVHAAKPSKVGRGDRKLPPDPDGLFERAAERGRKVVEFYEKLYPDPGRDQLLANLLHDLLHLCDRDRTLGSFDKSHGHALGLYVDSAAENMWVFDWYDDLETAREAAWKMLLQRT